LRAWTSRRPPPAEPARPRGPSRADWPLIRPAPASREDGLSPSRYRCVLSDSLGGGLRGPQPAARAGRQDELNRVLGATLPEQVLAKDLDGLRADLELAGDLPGSPPLGDQPQH